MGMTNFLNNLFGFQEQGVVREGGTAAPGGIGNNPSTWGNISMIPGVPSIQYGAIYAAGGSLHGRTPLMYSGTDDIDIAHQIRPVQGGHPDLYSFRVHAPAVPSRSMGVNEIAYQIQRNISSVDMVGAAAPPVPTNGWLPPALQVPLDY